MSGQTLRVAGTDPGTSSLDVLVLEDGEIREQIRFLPEQLRADPAAPVRWLESREPFDLVAGPSGYGLPLVRAAECSERERQLMSLVRPDERGRAGGVAGFSAVVEAFCASELPVVFLPGAIHLPTVPPHRKINRIDLGTPDKVAVVALALALWKDRIPLERFHAGVLELGSAFTSCLMLHRGEIVEGMGGTSGLIGWGSPGAWDGELAYLMSPLRKSDLFGGGIESIPEVEWGQALFRESLGRLVHLLAREGCEWLFLSGRLLERHPELIREALRPSENALRIEEVGSLPGAWVKQSAQGAAVLADGLTGGRWADVVERLRLREAAGTVLDWVRHPRFAEVLAEFS